MQNYINKIVDELENKEIINTKTSFEYARICSQYLRDPHLEGEGRRIIINVLENWNKIDSSTHEMWTDLVESAGFYPYLEAKKEMFIFKNTPGEIRKEFHKSKNIKEYLHEEQYNLKEILNSGENLIVSAPTSFGKSLLIEEMVAMKKYKNIVIIQPTLALIDETRKKLKDYNKDYKIIVRTTQEPSTEKRNLYIFTAERVMEYSGFPKIDFFVIDEFYKLSAKRDEERSDVLNNAFNLLTNNYKSNFYLLGPNIDDISEGFAEKYNSKFIKTEYSLVDNRVIDEISPSFEKGKNKNRYKEKRLFDLLFELKNEQTIIYCSSPDRVRYLSTEFCNYLIEKKFDQIRNNISLIEWIKNNVDPKWGLINCLKYGIGIHNGALQKHMSSSIIQYFNQNKLNYLFCTTTIIEGVNTSAKNVIFYDKKKGFNKDIDYFDYSNIKGRSGRMMVHYIGRIYNFNKPPEKKSVVVDVPFFEQTEISDEILIHINEKDVKNKSSDQYKNLMSIPQEERAIFKKNGVSVKGQKNILEILKKDIHDKHHLLCWDGFPKYNQLRYILFLAWNNLLKKGETIGTMTHIKLVRDTNAFCKNKNILKLIYSNYEYYKKLPKFKNKSDNEVFDIAVINTFQIEKHWFHYKVPKWLNVMNNLQKYVCEINNLPSGNYSFLSSQIENEFVKSNFSILREYQVPKSAIEKLQKMMPNDLSEDDIINEIKNRKLFEKPDFIQYEREKILENL